MQNKQGENKNNPCDWSICSISLWRKCMIHASCNIPRPAILGDTLVFVLPVFNGTFNVFGLVGDIFSLVGVPFGVLVQGTDFLVAGIFERQIVPVFCIFPLVFGVFLLGNVALEPIFAKSI
jgi:hypothetical protein